MGHVGLDRDAMDQFTEVRPRPGLRRRRRRCAPPRQLRKQVVAPPLGHRRVLRREDKDTVRALDFALCGKNLGEGRNAGELQGRPTDGDGDFRRPSKMEAGAVEIAALYVAAANLAATTLRVRIEFHDVSGFAAYEPLIQQLVSGGINAAELVEGPSADLPTSADYERIAALFMRYRLPTIGPARLGFLLQCEFAEDLIAQRIAYFVGRILHGTKPAELPVEEFSTLQLILNLKTARALGIAIPRALLIRAGEVIQ